MDELDVPVAGDAAAAAAGDGFGFFEAKQLLEDAARQQIAEQVPAAAATDEAEGLRTADDVEAATVYVVEWMEDETGRIVGLGSDRHGRVRRLKLRCSPGLFVATAEPHALTVAMRALGYPVHPFPFFRYAANNFSPLDVLSRPECADEPCLLAKITTPTVNEANRLYRRFRDDEHAYRYAAVPFYWNVTTQVVFERMLRFHETCEPDQIHRPDRPLAVPRVTMRWFDDRLTSHDLPAPRFPVITFDIETVATAKTRVPRGDNEDDELFSTSVHHVDSNVMYTLVYLPHLDGESSHARYDRARLQRDKLRRSRAADDDDDDDAHARPPRAATVDEARRLIYDDGYPTYEDESFENRLEVYASERELLERTMDLLRPRDPRTGHDLVHYLVGYNSMSYDIRFLLLRCAFYDLECASRFVYRNGFTFGYSQLHLDLFRIIITQYRFKRYRLNDVAQELLKEGKTGVDAVLLRYTFHAIRARDRYIATAGCVSWPSVPDILHYNNYDTLLVSKLLRKTRSVEFTLNQAHEARIPLSSLSVNYNKMRFKLWSRCFVVGLELGLYLSTFKSPTVCVAVPPLGGPTRVFCLDEQLQGEATRHCSSVQRDTASWQEKRKKVKYPGGANFCLGEYHVRDVQVLDYRIAYPLAIERLNISDETATIVPASLLLAFHDQLDRQQRRQEFRLFDYVAHTGATRPETHLLYYQYIYHGLHCGGEFPFERDQLQRRGDQPVTVIWQGRKALLSQIIARFNTMREDVKSMRNAVQAVVQRLDTMAADVEELRRMESAEQQHTPRDDSAASAAGDDDDGDDDAEDFGCFDAMFAASAGGLEDDGERNAETGNNECVDVDGDDDFACFDEFLASQEPHGAKRKPNGKKVDRDNDDFACFDEILASQEPQKAKRKPNCKKVDRDDDFACFDEILASQEPHEAKRKPNGKKVDRDNDDGDDDFACFDELLATQEPTSSAREPADKSDGNDDEGDDFACFDEMLATQQPTTLTRKDGDDRGCNVDDGDGDDFSCFGEMLATQCEAARDSSSAKAHTDDDDSARVNEVTGVPDAVRDSRAPPASTAAAPPPVDPLIAELTFVNEYFDMQRSRTLRVHRDRFEPLDYERQLELLAAAKSAAEYDADRLSNRYALMKSLVASIYGCIGTSAKVCAALITCTIRSTLLLTAQHLVRSGYTVYYMDTDSLFIKHPTRTDDPSAELNQMFPYTEIEMKLYRECMFVRKKTYYTTTAEGEIKYSQHLNGPPTWREFVQFAYDRDTVANSDDVARLFRDFFALQYDRLMARPCVDDEFVRLVGQEVRTKLAYKSNTHLAKLRDYLTNTYPDVAVQKRHLVYYEMAQDVTAVRFRPTFELRDPSQLRTINLFKFYQSVFKTVYNILGFHLKRNNAPLKIALSERPFLLSMITAFLDEHRARFPETYVNSRQLQDLAQLDLQTLNVSSEDDDVDDENGYGRDLDDGDDGGCTRAKRLRCS